MNIRTIDDSTWFDMLIQSTKSPQVNGVNFPRFPSAETQSQFVGSSNEAAMHEGFQFYKVVKGYADALGMPLSTDHTNLLDFGCGWGRYLRILQRDIDPSRLFGVDTDPTIIQGCRDNGVTGELCRIFPNGRLPFPDSFFDCMIAYSVFTHLPEPVYAHWMSELIRVSKPGCIFVFTVESNRFLDFLASLGGVEPESLWHQGLKAFSPRVEEYRKHYRQGKFIYLPTGGGDFRAADVYGDAIIPRAYIEKNWAGAFRLVEFIDNPDRFWQSVVVAQKP